MKSLCIFILYFSPFLLSAQSKYIDISIIHPSKFNYNILNNIGYRDYKTNTPIYFKSIINKIDSNHTAVKVEIDEPTELFIMGNFLYVEPNQKYDIRYVNNDSVLVTGEFYGNKVANDLLQRFKVINFKEYINNENQLQIELIDLENGKMNVLDSLKNLNIISSSAYKFYKNEIKFGYLNTLVIAWKSFFPNSEKFENFVNSQFNDSLFIDEENLKSKYYGFSLIDYIINIKAKRVGHELTKEHLIKSIDFTKNHLNGKQKDFALAYIFGIYCRKQNIEHKELLGNIFNELNSILLFEEYKKTVLEWHSYYNKANNKLPDELLNIYLKNTKSEYQTLGELINKTDSPYLIDFWASWCSPCIAQIKNYSLVRNNIDNRIKLIFISLDDISKEKEYLKLSNKLNIETYIITNSKDKILLEEYFQIPPIPRTIQMNKYKILNLNFDLHRLINSN